MADHDKATPIPNAPRITMKDAVTGKRAELFATPGYIPTEDDVRAVIEARGQWGSAPRFTPCKSCGFPVFGTGACEACNAIQE